MAAQEDIQFFFYDYESFGKDVKLDRLAQFAGIRTDKDFNKIGEPLVLYCQQTNDYLPDPEGVLIHGIGIQKCQTDGIAEYAFAQKIHQAFCEYPNTCILGFNNLRFDDELSRRLFYRNLLDPYEWEYVNGNSRWDLLDVARACFSFRPDGIHWPHDENGKITFRLSALSSANHLDHANAHDALSDVRATIALAKLIRDKQPKLFHYFFEHRTKKKVHELLNTNNLQPLAHVSGKFGNERYNTSVVCPLIVHPVWSNKIIVCDLLGHVDVLIHKTEEELYEYQVLSSQERAAQNLPASPLKLVSLNKCPIVTEIKYLQPENEQRLHIDSTVYTKNFNKLVVEAGNIRNKVSAVFTKISSCQPDESPQLYNVEADIYKGVYTKDDTKKLAQLRQLSPQELAKHGLFFNDKRVEPLLFHYRARYFPYTLTDAEHCQWETYRLHKLHHRQTWLDNIRALREEHANSPTQTVLLDEMEAYGKHL